MATAKGSYYFATVPDKFGEGGLIRNQLFFFFNTFPKICLGSEFVGLRVSPQYRIDELIEIFQVFRFA